MSNDGKVIDLGRARRARQAHLLPAGDNDRASQLIEWGNLSAFVSKDGTIVERLDLGDGYAAELYLSIEQARYHVKMLNHLIQCADDAARKARGADRFVCTPLDNGRVRVAYWDTECELRPSKIRRAVMCDSCSKQIRSGDTAWIRDETKKPTGWSDEWKWERWRHVKLCRACVAHAPAHGISEVKP